MTLTEFETAAWYCRPARYNGAMRRKSSINQEKRRNLVERARRMTPEQRLLASANLSETIRQLELAGKRYREGVRKERP
jgi:hypothetical protein